MDKSNQENLKTMAMFLARFVRDGVEDMHVEGKSLTDDNMKEFNIAVRKAIYAGLLIMGDLGVSEKIQSIVWVKSPPDYWETDVLDTTYQNHLDLLDTLETAKTPEDWTNLKKRVDERNGKKQ